MPCYRPYEAIAALAGAGKTYLLTTRFIGLLSSGVAPDRILAITFTRKAAAEILERVMSRLAAAAVNDSARADLLASLRDFHGKPSYELPSGAPLTWLRQLVDALPRLRIGTIDSFFLGITQAFALELGLPLRVELMDDPALDAARSLAVERALARAREDAGARAAFREAFKRATAGKSKTVTDTLRSMVDSTHGLYLDLPDGAAWGARERIWTSTPWWVENGILPDDLPERLADLETGYVARQDPTCLKAWTRIINAIRTQSFDTVIDETLFRRLLEVRADLRRGRASFKFGRRKEPCTLDGEDARTTLALLALTISAILRNLLHETQGRFRLMELYEDAYRLAVRGQGRLAFGDIPFLLRSACTGEKRLNIDYRLDSRFDHWMLDEFQDTSLTQWKVLGSLADEVLQSTEPGRGFFYVGDVKQAIYGWRGGESALFEHVRSSYAHRFGLPLILDQSWRSSPIVLDAVNRVFGSLPTLELIPAPVCAKWNQYWRPHLPVPRHASLPGRVELHVVDDKAGDDDPAATETPILRQTALLVESLVSRGVKSIGVLVRLNSFGNDVADALRRRGLNARREINPALLDNGTVSAILSLLHLADHPSDSFAWQHVTQTPLGDAARAIAAVPPGTADDDARRRVAAFVRETACRDGITGVVSAVLDACGKDPSLTDPFISLRMRQLLETALDFDRRRGEGPSSFAGYAASLMVADPGATAGITVMTVHKAKGLEFDAVVLPDLQGRMRGFTEVNAGDLTVGGDPAHPWVFPMPKQAIAPLDPVIEEFRERAVQQKTYDELCLLYVAMTRARKGLYMVTSPAPADKALYAATILQKALAPQEPESPDEEGRAALSYAAGDEDWMKAAAPRDKAPPQPAADLPFKPGIRQHGASGRRLVYQTPSGQEERTTPRMAETLFRADAGRAIRRGSALHDLFQRIGWIEEGDPASLVAEWTASNSGLPADVREEVLDSFRRAVANPAVRTALARPDANSELWREQAFELSLEGTWISGRFDRVVLTRDPSGAVVSASILDFKSDRVSADEAPAHAARYHPQVASYRAALSRLTGIPESAIAARLLFTHPCCVIEA